VFRPGTGTDNAGGWSGRGNRDPDLGTSVQAQGVSETDVIAERAGGMAGHVAQAAGHGAEAGTSFATVMDRVAQGFEALGVAVLVVGVIWSAVLAVLAWRRSGSGEHGMAALRRTFGASLLLGLEVLVAADLIRTIAVAPSVDNVLVLGLIVLIRTFLSISLETEIEGVPPWRRATITGASHLARATTAATRPRPD
jgi:uncharacterized membrane protein